MVTWKLVRGGLAGGCLGGFLGSGGGGAGGWTATALIPGWEKIIWSGSSRSAPVKATSTVVPALPPGGVRWRRRGRGRVVSLLGWPRAVSDDSDTTARASR